MAVSFHPHPHVPATSSFRSLWGISCSPVWWNVSDKRGCPSCPPGCCLSVQLSSFLPFLFSCLPHANVWSASSITGHSNLTLHIWWTGTVTGDVIICRFLIFCLCPKSLVAVTPSSGFYRQLQKLLWIIKSPCLLPAIVLNQLFSLFLTITADLTSS